jgi:hypothetical protein
MILLPKGQRHAHDCETCVYRGSSWSAVTQQHDWYTCLSGAADATLLRRNSSEPSDYSSAALFGSAAGFDFVREALREGILKIVVNDAYKATDDEWMQ